MNNSWFKKHLKNIKRKAGARYTPQLNIDLPISEIFDGISRTEKFYITTREKYGELLREFRYVTSKFENAELQKAYVEIKKEADSLFKIIERIKEYNTVRIPWDEVQKQTKVLQEHLWKFADQLRTVKEKVKDIKTPAREDGSYQPSPAERLNYDIQYIYKTQTLIRYFEELSLSTKAQLSNHTFLLLTGSAGTGKTHLLCDVVEHRIKNGKGILPAFLIFSEYFSNNKEFWEQTIEQLELKGSLKTKKDFLRELNEFGKRAQCRSLLVIDALNENITQAPNFWKNNLDGIIKDIKKYPNIALIISVRNGFEKEVLTEKQKEVFIHEEHSGFRFREWEAVNKFFKAFKLPLPEIPLLMPEFQNPLFLLLFCKAFEKRKNKKDKQIFRGHEGATYIFETYIDSISKPIEKKFKIDSGPKRNIWDTVIEKIAEEMVTQDAERISEKKLTNIIQKAHPKIDSSKLIQSLASNMLVVKVPKYENGERTDGFDIRFPFQKFSDHLIGRYIFKKYENEFGKQNKNLETAKKYFSKKRNLGKLLSNSWNSGIIEALSIQCPEQLKGIEFIEVAPFLLHNQYFSEIEKSFVESLIWRNPKAFSIDIKNTLKIINRNIIRTESGNNKLLNAFLSVAPIPNHPFNAAFLNKHLSKISMPKRDSWWSTFLHYQYGERSAVDRILEWSWSDQDYSHVNDESIILTCIALSWFLTTSNRFVRDKATKGLVCLLQNRIHLLSKLLEIFKNVNDPYVIERLYAVAYGCVLRNQKDIVSLKTLAEWIYKNIFKDNKPPVHILLRDYARGVIEVALRKGIKITLKEDCINPPYKSIWPKKIPSEKELREKYYFKNYSKNKSMNRDYYDIWGSLMYSFGGFPADFGNYVVSSDLGHWSGRRLRNPGPNRKRILEKFKEQLAIEEKALFEEATNPFYGVDYHEIIKKIKSNDKNKTKENEIKIQGSGEEKEYKSNYIEFKKFLPINKMRYFEKEIEPFLTNWGNINDPLDDFDIKMAQRWIFNRVVELGYSPNNHGQFDKYLSSCDRREHKSERIGKKYQWIAYHEFMALVADHFEYKGDSWCDSYEESYKGPWQPRIRDIDTSFVLRNDATIKESATFSQWKLNYAHYDAWGKDIKDISDKAWIKTKSDLPNPKNIIQIIDDKKKEWLMLEGFIRWQEETPPEYKKYDIPIREFWYMTKSYIVKSKDAKKFYDWAKKQYFTGKWMPEAPYFSEIFLGEYPSSIAFNDLRTNYNVWTKSGKGNEDLQIPVVVTGDSYLNEFTLDCSYNGSVSVKLPCKWLVSNIGLYHNFLDGKFFDKNGNLITLATSIFEDNFPSFLLIDKKALIDFLSNNDFSIFWTLLCEKQMIGGSHSRDDYAGRLDISGVYKLNNNKVIGEYHDKFNE